METKYYTVERGQQILVSLLKQHGIRKVIASPGTTNITFVASVMSDPFLRFILPSTNDLLPTWLWVWPKKPVRL